MSLEHPELPRRAVLRSATAVGLSVPLLVACGTDDDQGAGQATEPPDDTGDDSPDGGPTTLSTDEVPVGGGKILAEDQVVVTQPAEGEFKAFSAVCTHQQCLVGAVADGEISCPCHGSRFSVEDGSVLGGPAPSALDEKDVTVDGGRITLG